MQRAAQIAQAQAVNDAVNGQLAVSGAQPPAINPVPGAMNDQTVLAPRGGAQSMARPRYNSFPPVVIGR
jgi:hypothetical protein